MRINSFHRMLKPWWRARPSSLPWLPVSPSKASSEFVLVILIAIERNNSKVYLKCLPAHQVELRSQGLPLFMHLGKQLSTNHLNATLQSCKFFLSRISTTSFSFSSWARASALSSLHAFSRSSMLVKRTWRNQTRCNLTSTTGALVAIAVIAV